MLFIDHGRVRFGMVVGDDGKMLKSPFSAPFGGLEVGRCQRLSHYLDAYESLKRFAEDRCRNLLVTLPPQFYYEGSHVVKQEVAMRACGFELAYSDIDHYIPAILSANGMREKMWPEARNKLNFAERQCFCMETDNSMMDNSLPMIQRAYGIIKDNRDEKGYTLWLSLEDVIRTVRVVSADFFVVTLDRVDVAAAMVYHVTEEVVQVIYWGDKPGYSRYRPMNLLASKIVEHYSEQGKIVDVGPSSSQGVPSIGLCDFKESVGCSADLKQTFVIEND
ncbi:MAG: hypothetical protein NC453_07835 [Muribaculum sp.]|nr:hypothetical protein [Muribaculum sp.]